MFAQVFTVVLLAVFVQSAFAATCSRTYTIVAGDYCDKISRAQNVSTYQLSALNPSIIDKGCNNLIPGESICLGFAGEDCSTTYVVKPQDTCAVIAASNALNMTILRLNNPQLDEACDIYVGEVLCTSKKVEVPAIPASGITVTMGGSAPLSTISPHSSSVSSTVVATPASTPAPSHHQSIIPSSSVKHTSTAAPPLESTYGDDDDNLPFCDEL